MALTLSQAAQDAGEEDNDIQDEVIRAALAGALDQVTLHWANQEDTPDECLEAPTIAEAAPRVEAARGMSGMLDENVPDLPEGLATSLDTALPNLEQQQRRDGVMKQSAFESVKEIAKQVIGE